MTSMLKELTGYSDDDFKFIESVRQLDALDSRLIDMNVLVLCTAGKLTASVGGKVLEMQKKDFVICPPGVIPTDIMVSPEFECRALCITNKGIQTFLRPYIGIWNRAVYSGDIKIRRMNDREMEFASKAYDLAKVCYEMPDSDLALKKDLLREMVKGALTGICCILLTEQEDRIGTGSGDNIFQRFIDLLQNSKVKHLPKSYYAGKLCISPKYLTFVCKKNSGKTASEWIRSYTLADITYYLQETDRSIKEIAELTGFANTSFFGKYVKHNTGLTPREIRERK